MFKLLPTLCKILEMTILTTRDSQPNTLLVYDEQSSKTAQIR